MDIQVLYKDLTDNTLQMNIDSGYYMQYFTGRNTIPETGILLSELYTKETVVTPIAIQIGITI